ncbi:sensor histidine kinase [Clostridium arbusti]|uniref:sensor histidine kinase n=1 Tax=Clostridium arbusti TaxID=1137848 RepID=UPI0002892149|nr:HAMP domain-containing sensor histidine kinase [Clostridium arbusti]
MKKLRNILKTNSLKWQLLSRFFLILILLLVIIGVLQYVTMKEYLYGGKEQVLDSRFHNIDEYNLQQIQTEKSVIENSNNLIDKTIDSNMSAAVIDINGNRIAGASKGVSNTELHDISKSKKQDRLKETIPIPRLLQDDYKKLFKKRGTLEGYTLVKDENNNLQIVAFRKIGDLHSPSGLIQLSISAKPVQDILYRQLYTYVMVSILTLIMGGIFGTKVFKYTLKPLYNMTNIVENINVGQLNTRLPVYNRQLEINKLSSAFNTMLGKIEASFKKEQYIKEKMRQFISDASHELRTPLTSIHGFTEVLLRGAAKNEEQLNLALNSILMESERLNKLVNDLLLLTRLDQHVPIKMNKENINDIIHEIYPQLKILSGERKIELQLRDNALAYVNRNQIKQVIYNLVQNAVRHTDEEKGAISISTDYEDDFIVLKIKDNGIGISKENINKVFDRFFRSESHRSRKYGGYGLGLSIVKSIIDDHYGKIEVSSELGIGTIFSVYLKNVS